MGLKLLVIISGPYLMGIMPICSRKGDISPMNKKQLGFSLSRFLAHFSPRSCIRSSGLII